MVDCSVIQAKAVTKAYGGQVVLDAVDLAVAGGETVVFMGANGAGKTTLLRCLAGAIRPTSGRVLWFGKPAGADPTVRRHIGVVGHESYLYPNLTVEENLRFAARMCDVPNPLRRVADLLADARMRHCAGRLAGELSRGQKQRIALLRSLVHEPRVLLLDEPFAGLDPHAANWLFDLLRELRGHGIAACLALHEAAMARRIADRVLVLEAGQLRIPRAAGDDVATASMAACA
jgi:heme ABC exporter ATP-binding subunit CcmA